MIHGLTFIGLSHSSASANRWREQQREITASLDRHQRIVLAAADQLTDQERQLLQSIDRQLRDPQQKPSALKCPECGRAFSIVNVDGMEIDCCRYCRGMWFQPGELSYFSGQSKEIPSDNLAHRESRRDCPVCSTHMTEFVFQNPHTLLVDRCPNGHGVYLEDRELERVFEITAGAQ
jgi:Zn-finger nucleic acid-binding protein